MFHVDECSHQHIDVSICGLSHLQATLSGKSSIWHDTQDGLLGSIKDWLIYCTHPILEPVTVDEETPRTWRLLINVSQPHGCPRHHATNLALSLHMSITILAQIHLGRSTTLWARKTLSSSVHWAVFQSMTEDIVMIVEGKDIECWPRRSVNIFWCSSCPSGCACERVSAIESMYPKAQNPIALQSGHYHYIIIDCSTSGNRITILELNRQRGQSAFKSIPFPQATDTGTPSVHRKQPSNLKNRLPLRKRRIQVRVQSTPLSIVIPSHYQPDMKAIGSKTRLSYCSPGVKWYLLTQTVPKTRPVAGPRMPPPIKHNNMNSTAYDNDYDPDHVNCAPLAAFSPKTSNALPPPPKSTAILDVRLTPKKSMRQFDGRHLLGTSLWERNFRDG